MNRPRWLRLAAALAICATAACGGRSEEDSAGDAGAIEVDALNYEVSQERYQQWVKAQAALDTISGLGEPPSLDPSRATESDIDRAVAFLESDPRARAALQRAGVSARDYVLTTLALDQALVASTAGVATSPRGAPSASASAPSPPSGAASAAQSSEPSRARRTRTRYRNVPSRNVELVERNRQDIDRVRSSSRFVIVKERPVDDVAADEGETTAAVPAGTAFSVRAGDRICATTHKVGDRVNASVVSSVSSGSGAAIPAGATVSLTVAGAPGEGTNPTPTQFTLNSITIDGRTYNVAGEGTASRVTRERIGSASKDAQKVAGGAAIGAVAGQVLGRDTKSTVIGAAVGAAAGAAAASASARYDTCVPAGTPIEIRLRDALNVRA